MSDGLTEAQKEDFAVIEKWKEDELHQYLKIISTSDLVDELSRRDGVRTLESTEYHWYKVFIEHEDDHHSISDSGKGRILVVRE